jgi:tagatose-1,6-bisphosphate aldolase non-catalytic subunit AgaZ/GatZ
MSAALKKIAEANRANGTQGIYSVCSAHRQVIEAAVLQAKSDRSLLLIEATCNQVNQEGGYTGMTPNDFRDYVQAIAAEFDFPTNQLILGGDHLGPNPWRPSRPRKLWRRPGRWSQIMFGPGLPRFTSTRAWPAQMIPKR